MRLSGFAFVPAAMLLILGSAGAADLTKVDRTIGKEPAYQSKPKYGLLVFGPEAKHRVWLVLDGDRVYVDKNGNGDLTEEGERVEGDPFLTSRHPAHERERSIKVGDLSVGGLTHTGLTLGQTEYRRKVDLSSNLGGSSREEWQEYLDSIWRQVPDGLVCMVSIQLDMRCYGLFGDKSGRRVMHFAWIDRNGQLAFADRPQAAPIVHFGGPLTLRVSEKKLPRGENPGQTTLCLGTPGVGPGAFATSCYDIVPEDIHPVVEVRFPAKEPDSQPVTRKYVLKQRC